MNNGGTLISSMRLALAGTVVMVLMGCGEPSEVTGVITAPLALPPDGILDGLNLSLPQGRSLAFVAQPLNGDETLKSDITLVSEDGEICKVFKTKQMNQFAVVGESVGQTTLRVLNRDGNVAEPTFSVQVTAP